MTYRVSIEVEEGRAEELPALGEDIGSGGANVGRGRVIKGGHSGEEGVIIVVMEVGLLGVGELREGEETLDA